MGFVFKENPTFWYKTHQNKQFLKVCALGKKRICNKKKKEWAATVEQRAGVLNFNLLNSKIEALLYFCMRDDHTG